MCFNFLLFSYFLSLHPPFLSLFRVTSGGHCFCSSWRTADWYGFSTSVVVDYKLCREKKCLFFVRFFFCCCCCCYFVVILSIHSLLSLPAFLLIVLLISLSLFPTSSKNYLGTIVLISLVGTSNSTSMIIQAMIPDTIRGLVCINIFIFLYLPLDLYNIALLFEGC